MEAWEALYRAMLSKFLATSNSGYQTSEEQQSSSDNVQSTGSAKVMVTSNEPHVQVVNMLEKMVSHPSSSFNATFNHMISDISRLLMNSKQTLNNFKTFYRPWLEKMINGNFGHSLSLKMDWHMWASFWQYGVVTGI